MPVGNSACKLSGNFRLSSVACERRSVKKETRKAKLFRIIRNLPGYLKIKSKKNYKMCTYWNKSYSTCIGIFAAFISLIAPPSH